MTNKNNNFDFDTIKFNFNQSKPLKYLGNAFSYVGMFGGILGFNLVVYRITNFYNGKLYFGQTNNLLTRMLNHQADLNRGKHANKELQQDYNDLRKKRFSKELQQNSDPFVDNDDPILNGFSCDILYHKLINNENNLDVVIQEVLKTLEIEQIVIADAILARKQVYNLSGLAGKASIIQKKFFSSIVQVREYFNISIEDVMIKLNDDNQKEWNYIPNETFTIQALTSRRVIFLNPVKRDKKKKVYNSLREAEVVLGHLYKQLSFAEIDKYYSYGIKFSRREITKICDLDENPYLYYEKNQDKRM